MYFDDRECYDEDLFPVSINPAIVPNQNYAINQDEDERDSDVDAG